MEKVIKNSDKNDQIIFYFKNKILQMTLDIFFNMFETTVRSECPRNLIAQQQFF